MPFRRISALFAAGCLAAAACDSASPPPPTGAEPRTSVPSSQLADDSLPASCQGAGADTGPAGVSGRTQEEYAADLAATWLSDAAQTVERLDPCAVVLQPSGTRLDFAAAAADGGQRLLRASSFADEESPSLSLSVMSGLVSALSPIVCAGCQQVEYRLSSAQGATPPARTEVPLEAEFASDASWTSRGLVLRYLVDGSRTGGLLVVAVPDGDFAAG